MIFSFLFFINYLYKVIQTRIHRSTQSNNDLCEPVAIQILKSIEFDGITLEDDDVGVRFMPPAYNQRYLAVCNVLVQLQSVYDIKKVVDLGCSEIGFFSHIKRIETIEEYIAVDIDLFTLERSSCRVTPLHADYLSRRCTPLKVSVLQGCATEPDNRLKDTNAIVAIELIEHLYPWDLEILPYNIFSIIQPDVAIFTTPNADFNVLFKSLHQNTFRHDDHKFEWTREQFEDWGHNLTLRYPGYEVWFNGIAKGPAGTEELGCCSQIAVFVRIEAKTESNEFYDCYHSVHEVDYPYQTKEEKYNTILQADVQQFIDRFSQDEKYLVGDDIEIPLVDIINYISVQCSEERLKNYLEESEKEVELRDNQLKLVLPYSSDNDDEALSSYDDIIEEIYDGEESWIIDNNEFFNEEHWSNVLEDVNEMQPEPDSNFDQTDDVVRNLADQLECLIRSTRGEAQNENEQNNSGTDVPYEPKDTSVNDLVLPDEEDLRSDSVTPVGDSILQQSGSTGSGNTSKSSDTLVDNSLSPTNTIKHCMNNEFSENFALISPLKDSCSDTEQYPGPSSSNEVVQIPENKPQNNHSNEVVEILENKPLNNHSNDVVEIPENKPYQNNQQSSFDVKPSKEQKEINENIDIPSSSSGSLAREPGYVVIEESSNVKEVQSDQSSSLVTRSQSLENVNMYKCKDKRFRYSLNIDNKILDCDTSVIDMDLDTCKGSSLPSLTETYGSHSKAVDSGYPNSTQDMELDLTPEQVDEIITETESSLEDEESSADERIEPVLGNPPIVFADNVENGDVANNNRDGEGNNMEGGEVLPEELVFEDLVIGGEEVEAAGEHESDDDGLFLSALDVSNDTIVPEEMSSNEDTIFLFDLPSPTSFGSLHVEESISVQDENQFPSWLMNMDVWDDDNGSGDAGPDRGEDSSDLLVDREGQVDFYPGDARAAGEPTLPHD